VQREAGIAPTGRQQGVGERRRAIRALLEHACISTQEELLERLAAEGFEVTQSSVSRDLRALGVAKRGGAYVIGAGERTLAESGVPLPLLASAVLAVGAAGRNLVVVHTPAGLASALCRAIDEARWPEVVGTIAGNDTIFLACKGGADQARLLALLDAAAREVAP
jgi:transcriptional regulator of arginine metabolism